MRRKLRKDRLAVLLILVIAAAVLIVVFSKSAYRALKELYYTHLAQVPQVEMTFESADVATAVSDIESLKSDSRVTFNQSMMLINGENLLADSFESDVSEYGDSGVWMNDCIQDAYKSLSAEVKDKFSEKLYISSAYRTASEQQRQIEEEGDTAQQVGASEHQAGLALDVYILYHGGMGILETEAGRWINTDCWRYGFIIRYPSYGESETGIEYEPWHIRYVGLPHAEYIMRSGITLEGYLSALSDGRLYLVATGENQYIVTRQSGDSLTIPAEFDSAVVSLDNTGRYVMTFKIK